MPLGETLDAANVLVADGLVHNVGVSKLTAAMVDEAIERLETPLAVNQVEFHPFIAQTTLMAHLAQKNVPFEAYAPLAQGGVADDALLKEIGEKHDASPVQVALAWILSKPNAVVLPKTASPDRLASNLAAAEIELSEDELRRIDTLQAQNERFVSPDSLAPEWDD